MQKEEQDSTESWLEIGKMALMLVTTLLQMYGEMRAEEAVEAEPEERKVRSRRKRRIKH